MRQLIVLSMAVLCGGVAYWAFKTMAVKDTSVKEKARTRALNGYKLNYSKSMETRKVRSDKGKKRGPYKKGKQL